MDAVSMLVLGQELVAAASLEDAADSAAKKSRKSTKDIKRRRALPDHVNQALDDVEQQVELLTKVLGPAPNKRPTLRATDRRMDRVIRAFKGISEHWALLAGELAQGDTAAKVHDHLFSEGLEWITQASRKQWGVMDAKLKAIETDKLEPLLAELGLVPVLELARRLHVEYGQIAGVTAPRQTEEPPEVRERMDELAEALRTYALRVAGMYDRNQPQTAELVQALLKPIDDLRRARRRKRKDADAEADAGAQDDAGGSDAAE